MVHNPLEGPSLPTGLWIQGLGEGRLRHGWFPMVFLPWIRNEKL